MVAPSLAVLVRRKYDSDQLALVIALPRLSTVSSARHRTVSPALIVEGGAITAVPIVIVSLTLPVGHKAAGGLRLLCAAAGCRLALFQLAA